MSHPNPDTDERVRQQQRTRLKKSIIDLLNDNVQWEFYDPYIGKEQRHDFAERLADLLPRHLQYDDERVRQIRERRNALQLRHGDWPCQTVHNSRERAFQQYILADIDYLLSLLDSQAVARPVGWISCGLRHGHDRIVDIVFENADCAKAFIDGVEPVVGPIVAATRMRDRCVKKVREHLHAHPSEDMQSACGHNDSIQKVIATLEALTLEGEQEK